MNTATESLVTRYLRDLKRALHDVPSARRREIVDEIREHIDEAATSMSPEPNEAELRNILDQVGDPESIAAEACDRFGISRSKAGSLERVAIALLIVGGLLLPGVGWVIGAVLLNLSRTVHMVVLMVTVTLIPVLTAIYLWRRAWRS
jgi:uncharacterized membrane protein